MTWGLDQPILHKRLKTLMYYYRLPQSVRHVCAASVSCTTLRVMFFGSLPTRWLPENSHMTGRSGADWLHSQRQQSMCWIPVWGWHRCDLRDFREMPEGSQGYITCIHMLIMGFKIVSDMVHGCSMRNVRTESPAIDGTKVCFSYFPIHQSSEIDLQKNAPNQQRTKKQLLHACLCVRQVIITCFLWLKHLRSGEKLLRVKRHVSI